MNVDTAKEILKKRWIQVALIILFIVIYGVLVGICARHAAMEEVNFKCALRERAILLESAKAVDTAKLIDKIAELENCRGNRTDSTQAAATKGVIHIASLLDSVDGKIAAKIAVDDAVKSELFNVVLHDENNMTNGFLEKFKNSLNSGVSLFVGPEHQQQMEEIRNYVRVNRVTRQMWFVLPYAFEGLESLKPEEDLRIVSLAVSDASATVPVMMQIKKRNVSTLICIAPKPMHFYESMQTAMSSGNFYSIHIKEFIEYNSGMSGIEVEKIILSISEKTQSNESITGLLFITSSYLQEFYDAVIKYERYDLLQIQWFVSPSSSRTVIKDTRFWKGGRINVLLYAGYQREVLEYEKSLQEYVQNNSLDALFAYDAINFLLQIELSSNGKNISNKSVLFLSSKIYGQTGDLTLSDKLQRRGGEFQDFMYTNNSYWQIQGIIPFQERIMPISGNITYKVFSKMPVTKEFLFDIARNLEPCKQIKIRLFTEDQENSFPKRKVNISTVPPTLHISTKYKFKISLYCEDEGNTNVVSLSCPAVYGFSNTVFCSLSPETAPLPT